MDKKERGFFDRALLATGLAEDVPEPPAGKDTRAPAANSEGRELAVPSTAKSAPTTAIPSEPDNNKVSVYYKAFKDALERGVAAGFFKFLEVLGTFSAIKGMSEEALYQAAAVSLKTSGTSVTKVLTAHESGLKALDKEEREALQVLDGKLSDLDVKHTTAAKEQDEQIETLTQQIAALAAQLDQLNQARSERDTKAQAERLKYETSKVAATSAAVQLRKEIVDKAGKIKQYCGKGEVT